MSTMTAPDNAADQWRPIETAPNEESILVHYSNGDIELIHADENDYTWKPYKRNKLNEACGVSSPTHWMPLPRPPK